VGETQALELIHSCKPIGVQAALEIGLLDDAFGEDPGTFVKELKERTRRLARQPEYRLNLRRKHERRLDDESAKPLASYRAEELQRMWVNFFGPDPAYHEARRRFVFKGNPPPRPNKLALAVETAQPSWVHSQRYLSNSFASQLTLV